MLKSGIINESEILELKDNEINDFLQNRLTESSKDLDNFNTFIKWTIMEPELEFIYFYVQIKGYIVVYNNTVYYPEDLKDGLIDKIEYVKNGYKLEKKNKKEIKDGRVINKVNEIAAEIERIGFNHSISSENDLAFWYPKTKDLGFYSPKTIITPFSDEESEFVRRVQIDKLDQESIIKRLEIEAKKASLDLDKKLFLRLGDFSNKFNFETCSLNSIKELFPKLQDFLIWTCYKLEWQQKINLVLREFIKSNYERPTIYHGMPLNTEFRVFYDFDTKQVLGIYNYWETNTMLDNLSEESDIITFANIAREIERDFNNLKQKLASEVAQNLSSCTLTGRWSVDFLFDGEKFVLIDMAHAECSYYYEEVLKRERIK